MKDLVVLIPTFNRPHLLRVALSSVSKQTYRHVISKVIVSENGFNYESKAVCEEYTELKIEYFYQTEQLPVLDHLKWLMSLESKDYVAFLCDDDWWNIYHIEIAYNNLLNKPEVVAYFSDFIFAFNENKIKFSIYNNSKFLNINNVEGVNYDLLYLNQEDIFLSSLLITPFHFSALVCKANALMESVKVFDKVHPTYSDRALWPVLAAHGIILFNPLATAIVRSHNGQDSNNYSSYEWRNNNRNGSLLILELAAEYGVQLKSKLNDIYLKADEETRVDLNEEFERVFFDRENIDWYAGNDVILASDKIKNEAELRKIAYEKSGLVKMAKIFKKILIK